MPYISATELIMYAPCFLRFAIFLTPHRIDQVRQSPVLNLPFDRHSVALRHPPRRQVFRTDQRDYLLRAEITESVSHAGLRRFRGVTMPPLVAAEVITNF